MKRTALLYLFFAAILLSSCSSKLSRSKAHDMIIKQYGLPKAMTENLQYGTLNYGGNGNMANYPFEKDLVDRGLITFSVVGTVQYSMAPNGVSCAVSLTPEGEKYKLGTGQSPADAYISVYYVKVAEMQFIEITGIQQSSETSATVSYTWKYGSVTPFGEAFTKEHQRNQFGETYTDGKLYTNIITFTKFDDGWRISN